MNKKALIVVTNVSKYQGVDIDRATGLWLGEAVHFADELEKNGFAIDYVSPKGGYTPIDPHSIQADTMTPIDWKYYQDSTFMAKLGNTLKASEVNPDDYSVIYYAGGHGVIWDFPDNKELQEIARKIYENGGIISSVCHGAGGILNIKDSKGEYIIAGKKVTGFSDTEEAEAKLDKLVPYSTEQELVKRGANYIKVDNWLPFAIADNRVVTGQNPASGKAVAVEVLKLF